MEYVFLFELVKRSSNIVIYGLGNVGKSYIKQIEETNWCNIVAVSDLKPYHSKYPYLEPGELKDIKNIDYVVIAINSPVIATQVYEQLLDLGIGKDAIVNCNMRCTNFPIKEKYEKENSNLQIAIVEGGGFGDTLLDMLLIKKIVELPNIKCSILFFNKYPQYFSRFSDIVISLDFHLYKRNSIQEFDIVFHMHNIPIVQYLDYKRVKEQSVCLYNYCTDNIYMYDTLFSKIANNYRFTKYGLLLGKNRIEQLDIHGLLGISREEKLEIPIVEGDLKAYQLYKRKYITINRDVGNGESSHPKLWPVEYYQKLLIFIKKYYSEYKLVLIGKMQDPDLSPYVDIDLTGQLTLEETTVVLKHSFLLIASEGGLVHLNHFLHGKSMVFFGPTDPSVFGYKENINIVGNHCKEHCEWLVDNWMEHCALNSEKPECIYSLKPDIVIEKFDKWMKINVS